MENFTKILKNIIFFVIIICVTYFIIFRGENVGDIFQIILDSNKVFLVLCVLMMIIFFSVESVNIKRILNHLGENVNYISCLKYTLICFFFNGVTPAASGGQPMEAYYMSKDKIPLSKATLTLLIQMCSFKVSTIIIGIIAFIININKLGAHLISLFALGFLTYLIPLILILICIFAPHLMEKIINFFVKIISKIGFKNIDKKKRKINAYFKQYSDSSDYLKRHPNILIKSIFIVLLQVFFYYMVTVFVYKALGLSGYSFIDIFTRQALVYLMASWVPLPGAIGVSEAVYLGIFNPIFGEKYLHSALILSRGINFYLFIFVEMVIVLINQMIIKRKTGDKK